MKKELEQAKSKKGRIERHRKHIAENILTLKCKTCRSAFVDFSDCFAVRCEKGCDGRYFCAWCLRADFGSGTQASLDCHTHVRVCPSAHPKHRGKVFATPEAFNEMQSKRRAGLVKSYINDDVDPEDKQELLKTILKDLEDVQIDINTVK